MTKTILKLILLLILPFQLSAQDPAVVKKQANVIATALVAGDYKTVISYTYPAAVEIGGGKDKMLKMMSTGINQMKTQGFAFEKITVGVPGKFYKAGAEIHCLIPENIIIKTAKGRMSAKSNLLGISKDAGKSWSFLDLNQGTMRSLKQLFPNFNSSLIIPQPEKPVML